MKQITVIDARMGRGKTSAAIRYMNQRKGKNPTLFITPYLSEVERVCESCDYDEPGCDYMSKSSQLKAMMRRKANIASTHSLFTLMDDEALALASENNYSIIIDESLQVIDGVPVSPKDKEILETSFIEAGENGRITWLMSDYEGKFEGYKQMAERGLMYYCSGSYFELMDPKRFTSFDEVIIMTYLFEGQLLKAYFDFFDFDYKIVGVECDEYGYRFSDKPDAPTPIDYSKLIHIIGVENPRDRKLNMVGNGRTALSDNWYRTRRRGHQDVQALKRHLRNFFESKSDSSASTRLWTTFKSYEDWLTGERNRYATNFLALNARATNVYKDATAVAYLVNRFIDPNFTKFFAVNGIKVDNNLFALSEMLQFIWRSAIRDDKEIWLYIPSRRMRELLLGWIKDTNAGGTHSA